MPEKRRKCYRKNRNVNHISLIGDFSRRVSWSSKPKPQWILISETEFQALATKHSNRHVRLQSFIGEIFRLQIRDYRGRKHPMSPLNVKSETVILIINHKPQLNSAWILKPLWKYYVLVIHLTKYSRNCLKVLILNCEWTLYQSFFENGFQWRVYIRRVFITKIHSYFIL